MAFDAFNQAKLMKRYTGAKTAELPLIKDIDNLDDLKKLAGIGKNSYGQATTIVAADLAKVQRDRNIQPGTPEWFRLWFAKPLITGEKPYDKT
jgi:hypothetical protein